MHHIAGYVLGVLLLLGGIAFLAWAVWPGRRREAPAIRPTDFGAEASDSAPRPRRSGFRRTRAYIRRGGRNVRRESSKAVRRIHIGQWLLFAGIAVVLYLALSSLIGAGARAAKSWHMPTIPAFPWWGWLIIVGVALVALWITLAVLGSFARGRRAPRVERVRVERPAVREVHVEHGHGHGNGFGGFFDFALRSLVLLAVVLLGLYAVLFTLHSNRPYVSPIAIAPASAQAPIVTAEAPPPPVTVHVPAYCGDWNDTCWSKAVNMPHSFKWRMCLDQNPEVKKFDVAYREYQGTKNYDDDLIFEHWHTNVLQLPADDSQQVVTTGERFRSSTDEAFDLTVSFVPKDQSCS